MPVQTGSPVLDDALDGGIPEDRSVLVVGGPATGKSTLAMQFLQAGLERDERCLYVSTEQTPAEIRDAFAEFTFDLDHDNLAITTLHARVGDPRDQLGEGLTLQTLEGGDPTQDRTMTFTSENLVEYLRRGTGGCDRVVLDSASGLATLSQDTEVFRRAILDLIRLFSDEFEATSLLTAEGTGPEAPLERHELLQFSTHGVIRLWREQQNGAFHRFVRIEKMRGVDHDTRQYAIDIDTDGISVIPRRRKKGELLSPAVVPTGIAGFDDVLGGGIPEGAQLLLEYDGYADPWTLTTQLAADAVEAGKAVAFALPATVTRDRLDDFWKHRTFTVQEALDRDQLFLIEHVRTPADHHENVLVLDELDSLAEIPKTVYTESGNRDRFVIVDLDSAIQARSEECVQETRYHELTQLMGSSDVSLHVLNADGISDSFRSFCHATSSHVLEHRQGEDGIEFLQLSKGWTGDLGAGHVVEYVDDPPFVRIR